MKILFFGDVFGKSGRSALRKSISSWQDENFDFIIINGENISHGIGLAVKSLDEIKDLPIDAITTGNHIYNTPDFAKSLENDLVLRPANFYPGAPGKGFKIIEKNGKKLAVINLIGQVFMKQFVLSPFLEASKIIDEIKNETNNILVDFHAEATSEKKALGMFLDSKVSAVVGTHTHVPTADCQIFDNGTAYITDVGMVGPYKSILGLDPENIIKNYITQMPAKFVRLETDLVEVNAVSIEINDEGKAESINFKREIINIAQD